MNYSEHLNLKKPEKAEQYNIEHWNDNSDLIDAAIHNEITRAENAERDLQEQIDLNRDESRRIGIVPIEKGGTGSTTAQEALNTLHGSVTEQNDIDADNEVTFIKRITENVAEETPASLSVESVKLMALANKVFELIRGDTSVFSALKNGFVPKAGSAGSADFLSANGTWANPSFSENKIEVLNSSSYTVSSNTIFVIKASSQSTILLDDCVKTGCTVTIINTSDTLTHSLSSKNVDGNTNDVIQPNAFIKIAWNGTSWQNVTAPAIGKIVVQYPQEDSPDDLYPCTKWAKLSGPGGLYEGTFFRAEGGNAAAYIDKTGVLTAQLDAIQEHTHTLQNAVISTSGVGNAVGVLATPGVVAKNAETNTGTTGRFDVETRPINFTVRIWKRIA